MLGPPKSRDLDRSVLISVEMLVPKDHFYRQRIGPAAHDQARFPADCP